MCPSDIVMDKTIRHVERIIFILTSSNGHRSLVATKNDWNECRAFRCWVLDNDILDRGLSEVVAEIGNKTYRLTPSPISGHEVLVLAGTISRKDPFWREVHLRFKIRIGELVLEDLARISEVDGVGLRLPRGCIARSNGLIVCDFERLPWDMSDFRGVDGIVQVLSVSEGRIACRLRPGSPILHKLVDCPGRHLYLAIEQIREMEVKM